MTNTIATATTTTTGKPVVLRITRHAAIAAALAARQAGFGPEVQVVDLDLPYGDDPVAVVAGAVAATGATAFEATAPGSVLDALAEASLSGRLPPMLRPEWARGPDGRIVVIGKDANDRDIFQFGYYAAVVGLDAKGRAVTRPLAEVLADA